MIPVSLRLHTSLAHVTIQMMAICISDELPNNETQMLIIQMSRYMVCEYLSACWR